MTRTIDFPHMRMSVILLRLMYLDLILLITE